MTPEETPPVASVLILTYNQAHLVGDTLRGVLAQKTTFRFEIVIGDDASADDTAAVCEALGQGFPLLRVLRNPVNLGLIGNFHSTLAQCRGRYIALLGGDDIWTDPYKLEKQVSFLRAHPDYLISHTHNDVLDHASGAVISRRLSSSQRDGDCFEALVAKGNFITASTAVFDRQALSAAELAVLKNFWTEDYPLWLTLALKGKVHYVPEPCVRYRVIAGSVGRPGALEKKLEQSEGVRALAVHYCKAGGREDLLEKVHARNDVDILRLLLGAGEKDKARAFAKTIPLRRLLRFPRLLRYRLKAL